MNTGIVKFNQELEKSMEVSQSISYLKFHESKNLGQARFEFSLATAKSKFCADKIVFYDSELEEVLTEYTPRQNAQDGVVIQNLVFEKPVSKKLTQKKNADLSLKNGIYVTSELVNGTNYVLHPLYIDINAIEGYDKNFVEVYEVTEANSAATGTCKDGISIKVRGQFSINSEIFISILKRVDAISNGYRDLEYVKYQIENHAKEMTKKIDELKENKNKSRKEMQDVIRGYQDFSVNNSDFKVNYGTPYYSLEEVKEAYPGIDHGDLIVIEQVLNLD